jgi:hypothetical protein
MLARARVAPTNNLEQIANFTVARGCGFALLAIPTLMIGPSGDFTLALKAGGYLCLIMCSILVLMALRAPAAHYKGTELWLLLEPGERPQPAVAQQVIGEVLREVYLTFSLCAAWLAASLLVMAVL